MIISAKFNTVCELCKGPVQVGEKINWEPGKRGVSHADTVLCNERKLRNMQKDLQPCLLDTKLLPLVQLIKSVISPDLKWPTLRLQFLEDKIAVSITKGGHAPGSLAIKANGTFVGCVRPTGEVTGQLTNNLPLQDYLLSISTDKATLTREAVLYGKLTNSCSFCGLELTHDYSVMVGYGPICAEKWDLPHAYNGTADNVPSGLSVDQKKKYMELMMSEDDDEQTT